MARHTSPRADTPAHAWRSLTMAALFLFIAGCARIEDLLASVKSDSGGPVRIGFDVSILDPEWRLLWSISPIETFANDGGSEIAAIDGVLVFIGGLQRPALPELIGLDGVNGSVLWRAQRRTASALDTSPAGLFVGTRTGEVISLAPDTGSVIWRRQVVAEDGVVSLTAEQDSVIVGSASGHTVVIGASSGTTEFELDLPDFDRILAIEDDLWVTHRYGSHTLAATAPGLGATLWQVEFEEPPSDVPLVTSDSLYVRTGGLVGDLYGLDLMNGAMLWSMDGEILGTVGVGSEALFVLQTTGHLDEVDPFSGEAHHIARFDPSPFPLQAERGGYYVDYDCTSRTLYVALGDSAELYALSETQDTARSSEGAAR